MSSVQSEILVDAVCFHCGQPCDGSDTAGIHRADEHSFCCFGCKTVYELLRENGLCNYYELQSNPGVRKVEQDTQAYAALDDEEVAAQLLTFRSPTLNRVTFEVPAIHCISCIWLLENLNRLEPAVIRSEVNFVRKSVTVAYRPEGFDGGISLRRVAQVMSGIGYAPRIALHSAEQKDTPTYSKTLLLKLAVAAFAFGNIMLLSFPEYLGLDPEQLSADQSFNRLFGWLNMALSIPVLFYSASDYLVSAWGAIRNRHVNLDVPLSLGILALFFRSTYDIVSETGAGYFDSFAGLLFFLLLGKWFQQVTFENLSFDRDYRSFFPLSVQHQLEEGTFRPMLVSRLKAGDVIQVRNQEIIPCDSEMMDDEALADYSFVTGESRPVLLRKGELVYAGGRLLGKPVRLQVKKEIRQGHLTGLWNSSVFQKPDEARFKRMVDHTARRFTWLLLAVAVAAAAWWYAVDASRVWLVVSSILIVACPCALALSAPFTFGHMLRAFGRSGFFLKNADVLERMGAVEKVVFDKTGTLTIAKQDVTLEGKLDDAAKGALLAVAAGSAHPLSVRIRDFLQIGYAGTMPGLLRMEEVPGKGLLARTTDGVTVRLGSAGWLLDSGTGEFFQPMHRETHVYAELDGRIIGRFSIGSTIRPGLPELLKRLGHRCLALLSGDQTHDEGRMRKLFPKGTEFHFQQSPTDKMEYLRSVTDSGTRVMMVGDGLNDAGALRQSDVGVAVTDDSGIFTPSCDAILRGHRLPYLDWYLSMSRKAVSIVKWCFVISLLYNTIGLGFAVSGQLTPLVAAILMPLSSISVVVFTTLAVKWVIRNQPQES